MFVWSDNTTTLSSIHRCSSRSPLLMKCLRYVFWLSAIYNFRLTASYTPGIQNALADEISRLHEPYSVHCLQDILAASPLSWHMSLNRFFSSQQVMASLDADVRWLREQVFASNTRMTYSSQSKLHLTFCQLAHVCPVPLYIDNACCYIALLSHRLCINLIKQYLNIVHIMYLEAGHSNLFHNSWHVD